MNIPLLPCPFCGLTEQDTVNMAHTPAVYVDKWLPEAFCVTCNGCGCAGPFTETADGAREQWNRRWKPEEK